MIVSHRHRFIFVKTHKTAGSSLEVALARECGDGDIVSHMEDNIASGLPRNYGPTSALGPIYNRHKLLRKLLSRHSPLLGAFYYEHMAASRIRELVGEDVWNSYFTFCFERNPWDKVVSYYLWKKHGQHKPMLPFDEYLKLSTEDRAEKTPFIHALDRQGCLDRLQVSEEIVQLAEERMALWSELKEMSGAVLSPRVRDAVISEVEREYERREAELRAEYEARLADQARGRASAAASRIVDTLLQEIGR